MNLYDIFHKMTSKLALAAYHIMIRVNNLEVTCLNPIKLQAGRHPMLLSWRCCCSTGSSIRVRPRVVQSHNGMPCCWHTIPDYVHSAIFLNLGNMHILL